MCLIQNKIKVCCEIMFEITEKEATGEVAEIYQDIRETMNMPFPQTIWRNLATKKGALQWVWYSLKPIYQSGAVAHYASELRSPLDVPSVSTVPDSAFNILGISDQDRKHISEFLDSLNFGNSQNIIGLSALYTDPSDEVTSRTFKKPKKRKYSDLPSLMDLDIIGKDEKELFNIINHIGQEVPVGFPPAWSRGFARWPKLLAIIWNTLSMIDADGKLEQLKKKTKDQAFKNSSILASHINRTALPESADQILEQLKNLTQGGIPRALPVGLLLHKMLSR